MDEFLSRVLEQLIGRQSGPFHLRFILQPMLASIIAIRAGLHDAKANRPPYLWTVLSDRAERLILRRDGWKDIRKVFISAFLMDTIYQLVVFKWFYPVQALIVATLLALVPYVLIRGVANRIAKRIGKRTASRS